jgi:hypothetical protein
MYTIMLYAITGSFVLSLVICVSFTFFSCLIHLARTSRTMLKVIGKNGHLQLVPSLMRKHSFHVKHDINHILCTCYSSN